MTVATPLKLNSSRKSCTMTDKIRISCPDCGKRLVVKAILAGKRVRCPDKACAALLKVPPADDVMDEQSPSSESATVPTAAPRRAKKPIWVWSAAALGVLGVAAFAAWFVFLRAPAPPTAQAKKEEKTSELPAQEPGQAPAEKAEKIHAKSLAKEQLLGEWEGALKDGAVVALKFTEKLVVVSILAPGTNREKARDAAEWASGNIGRSLGGGGGFGIGSTAYEIDAEKNEVKIWGDQAWTATAKPKEGALLISGRLNVGTVTDVRVERTKQGDAQLAKDGPGDPALGYDVVRKDPAKFLGKRVTWSFMACSAEGKRVLCALDRDAALRPPHPGLYVVEFASDEEVARAFREAAFAKGLTITGTVAGEVDQFLVIRDGAGAAKKDVPKVKVPLLRYPVYKSAEKDKDASAGDDSLPGAEGPKLVNLVKSPFNCSLSASLKRSMETKEEWQPAYPPETTELFVQVASSKILPVGTRIEVKLRTPPGKANVTIDSPLTIQTAAVGTVFVDTIFPCRAAKGPLPEGAYQAEVWIDGVRTHLLNWAIKPGAPRPGKLVRLEEYQISDAKLKELAKVAELRVLHLNNGGGNRGTVSADGIRELAGLEQLHTLTFNTLPLDESCFAALASLRNISTLRIAGSFQLTDGSLSELGKMKPLKVLRLECWQPQFTTDGLKHLAALPQLESLEIGAIGAKVAVDDAGLKELAKIKTLKTLIIAYSPKITDAGLQELAALKELRFLSLRSVEGESKITGAGIAQLQKVLPACRIHR